MKDKLGLYYHPSLQTREVRMYVREHDGEIEFRTWNARIAEVWEKHGWVPYSAIERAAELYKKERHPDRNPLGMYDLDIARRLIDDEKSN